MVVIRLSRAGAKKRPYYNIVVADKAAPRDGRFIERLGFSNPMAAGRDTALRIDTERLEFWQKRGAVPSDAVRKLMRRFRKHEGKIIPNPARPSKTKRGKLKAAQAEGAPTPTPPPAPTPAAAAPAPTPTPAEPAPGADAGSGTAPASGADAGSGSGSGGSESGTASAGAEQPAPETAPTPAASPAGDSDDTAAQS